MAILAGGIPVTKWPAEQVLKSSAGASFSDLRYVVVTVAI